MVTPHSTDNYSIGKGLLKIGDFAASPTFVEVGNCPSIEVESTVERLEHFSSRRSLRLRDKYPVIQTTYTVNFDVDEIASENILRFVMGTRVGDQLLAYQDVDKEFSLQFVSDNPIGQNYTWTFHRGILTPNGAMALIGEEFQQMSFTFEGLDDEVNHASSPSFTVDFTTTTTTTTT